MKRLLSALAIALAAMDERGFGREDFAKFHPSGTLGKRLLLRVRDVMRPLADIATAFAVPAFVAHVVA